MNVKIGSQVLYKLSQDDLEDIMAQFDEDPGLKECHLRVGDPRLGDMVPAIVVQTNDDGSVNLKAFLNGDPDLWICGVREGAENGQYQQMVYQSQERPLVFRFSRLWSLTNYENMKADIERSFPSGTTAIDAMSQLSKELEGARVELVRRQKMMARYVELQNNISRNEAVGRALQAEKTELDQIKVDLGIKDIAPELAGAGNSAADPTVAAAARS